MNLKTRTVPDARARTASVAAVAVAVAVVAVATLALSGCASWQLSQQAWARSIEGQPGVESVDVSYRNTWPTGGAAYEAKLTLSPEVTEAKARSIAAASCAADTTITSVTVSNSDRVVGDGLVRQYDLAAQACIDADELARFAAASAAMGALEPGFAGSFEQVGWQSADPEGRGLARDVPADSYRVFATVADDADFVPALRELAARITDVPLSFGGLSTSEGQLSRPNGAPMEVRLQPGADIERIVPVLEAALALPYDAILVTDNAVSVRVDAGAGVDAGITGGAGVDVGVEGAANLGGSTGLAPGGDSDLDAAQLAALTEAAEAAGMAVGVSPVLLWSGDPLAEQHLVDALTAAPGGVTLGSDAETDLIVQAHTLEGMRAAAELLMSSHQFAANTALIAPGPGEFSVHARPGPGSVPGLPAFPAAAFEAAARAHEALPDATSIELFVEGAELRLTVRYPQDASYTRMQGVRAKLEPLTGLDSESELFDHVVVTPQPREHAPQRGS
ncbi:hypothetical protein ACFSWE_13720 [Leucobacter albus]|uniref:Uncharacterized protein n=1 Tax=Leucobacter albus TaxID=272210 RepID=A0ABW3TSR0_9MICO